jgi:hypothetical protein
MGETQRNNEEKIYEQSQNIGNDVTMEIGRGRKTW